MKIATIRHSLPTFQDHLPLAFSPKTVAESAARLVSDRIMCICAPWDSYSDEFFTIVERALGGAHDWIRLNFTYYVDVPTFHRDVDGTGRISYPELTGYLVSADKAVLLIDNVSYERTASGKTVLDEALAISVEMLRTLPNLKVVLRTRSVPQFSTFPSEVLRPLDEPGTNRFLLSHPLSSNITEASLAAGEVYRLTGGYPGALDKILQKLSYTKLSELATECSMMATQNVDTDLISPDLIGKINSLDKASSLELKDLLSIFCVFPFGEDITHLRNLRRDQPFYPMQSARLVSMGLLNTIEHDFFDREGVELPRVVISSFSANEYIRSTEPEKFKELNEQALEIYFGKDWRLGNYKLGSSFSEEKLQAYEYSTLNAVGMLRRLMKDASLSGDERELQDALGVINHYTAKLDAKCRYREICGLCIMLVPMLKPAIEWNSAQDILFRLGNALRMLSEYAEAMSIFVYLLSIPKDSRNWRARLNLHVAMLYEENKDEPNAIKHARLATDTSSKNSTYYHARSMIISRSKAKNVRAKLGAIQRKCASDSYHILANNIDIAISSRFESPVERRQTYKRIASSALGKNDVYNFVKACTRYVDLTLKVGEDVPKTMINSLKACFDYSRGQRLEVFFRSSLTSLWKILREEGDLRQLGKLTALSSKTLRLLNDENTEREYISKLVSENGVSPFTLSADHLHYLQDRMHHLGIKPSQALEFTHTA